MNRKHIITSIGVAMLAVGVVGGVWSGIQAMPVVINNVLIAQAKIDEPEIIYNSNEPITKLNIDSNVSHINIKKHDKPNIIVERKGNKEASTITTNGVNNELTINEERQNVIKETKNIDDIVKYFIDELYSSSLSEIIVYLPEKVNADIKTEYNGLGIMDDILLDTLNYETENGYISLSEDVNLENLNIKSSSDISIASSEISGIKNVKIISRTVNMHNGNYIEDETKIPEKVEIRTTNEYDTSYINVSTPVAKELVIDSPSAVEVNLPILDYKFNFDIKTSRLIEFEYSEENSKKYGNSPLEKYFEDTEAKYENAKEIKGLINESLENNSNEYFVKIKSADVIFN